MSRRVQVSLRERLEPRDERGETGFWRGKEGQVKPLLAQGVVELAVVGLGMRQGTENPERQDSRAVVIGKQEAAPPRPPRRKSLSRSRVHSVSSLVRYRSSFWNARAFVSRQAP